MTTTESPIIMQYNEASYHHPRDDNALPYILLNTSQAI